MEKVNTLKNIIREEIEYCKKSYRHLKELESAYPRIVLECEVLTNVRKRVQLTDEDFVIIIDENGKHIKLGISRKDFKVSYCKYKYTKNNNEECILTLHKKNNLYSLSVFHPSTKTECEIITDCQQNVKPLNKLYQYAEKY